MSRFSTTLPSSRKRSLLAAALLCLMAGQTQARIWEIGPARDITQPGQISGLSRDGDHIVLDPGVYRGCAIWTASNLTIEARRRLSPTNPTVMNQVIITGPPCGDRALFWFTGDNIVVRGLSFQNARDSQHNGAGILMLGANLTVENSQFLNNENGILAGGPPASIVRITASVFQGNGTCEGPCAHGLYVGASIARLEVTNSLFIDQRAGHHIKSRARATIIRDSRIQDGPTGTASYLIDIPDGGDVEIINNQLEKGPRSENRETAISIGAENETTPSGGIEIRGNRFISGLANRVVFVRVKSPTAARLTGNALIGDVTPLVGPATR